MGSNAECPGACFLQHWGIGKTLYAAGFRDLPHHVTVTMNMQGWGRGPG